MQLLTSIFDEPSDLLRSSYPYDVQDVDSFKKLFRSHSAWTFEMKTVNGEWTQEVSKGDYPGCDPVANYKKVLEEWHYDKLLNRYPTRLNEAKKTAENIAKEGKQSGVLNFDIGLLPSKELRQLGLKETSDEVKAANFLYSLSDFIAYVYTDILDVVEEEGKGIDFLLTLDHQDLLSSAIQRRVSTYAHASCLYKRVLDAHFPEA